LRKTIEKSVPCGIVALDLDGNQTYVNLFFSRMVGWVEEELVGQILPLAGLPGLNTKEIGDYFQSLLFNSTSDESIELQFLRKNGERFWGLIQTAPLNDREGNQIGLLLTVVDITRQKQSEKKLRVLSSKLIDAQETERKHVSAELHDSIGGRLAGIKYSLEKILYDIQNTNQSLENPLQEILSVVGTAIEEAQRITKNLHPSILDDLGVLSAMRSFCREFQDFYANIAINLNLHLYDNQIPEPHKILIYRVMQEALNNIAKHSGADTVDVTLEKHVDRIVLSVHDNGQGFDLEKIMQDEKSQGIGLRSMSDRTELFGGALQIKAKPGSGTLIQASWPDRII
jgi:PAS domain S-box-containing protein